MPPIDTTILTVVKTTIDALKKLYMTNLRFALSIKWQACLRAPLS